MIKDKKPVSIVEKKVDLIAYKINVQFFSRFFGSFLVPVFRLK